MLVRNLPTIEPSAEFMNRLSARLAEIGPPSYDFGNPKPVLASFRAFVVLAAGIGAIAVISIEASRFFGSGTMTPAVAPVVATTIDWTPAPAANAGIVASVPTGMPVWPAVLMVGEAPLRFANMEFHESTR